jgi:hypothetical protein
LRLQVENADLAITSLDKLSHPTSVSLGRVLGSKNRVNRSHGETKKNFNGGKKSCAGQVFVFTGIAGPVIYPWGGYIR